MALNPHRLNANALIDQNCDSNTMNYASKSPENCAVTLSGVKTTLDVEVERGTV